MKVREVCVLQVSTLTFSKDETYPTVSVTDFSRMIKRTFSYELTQSEPKMRRLVVDHGICQYVIQGFRVHGYQAIRLDNSP
jgi:hypothetical protein